MPIATAVIALAELTDQVAEPLDEGTNTQVSPKKLILMRFLVTKSLWAQVACDLVVSKQSGIGSEKEASYAVRKFWASSLSSEVS